MFFCYICIRKTFLEQCFTQGQSGFTCRITTLLMCGNLEQFLDDFSNCLKDVF